MRLLSVWTNLIVALLLCASCGGGPQPPQKTVNSVSTPEEDFPAPVIKVYVENSGSMDGYVKDASDFKNAVYNYLSDLQLANIGRRSLSVSENIMELNYINSNVLAFGSDVSDFIMKLNPYTFKIRGGNRGTSDLSNVIGTVLNQMDSTCVSVFVSDCIFSPGKQDATPYLISQGIGIKGHIVKKMYDIPRLSFVIMQLTSQFDGYYYNRFDAREYIKDVRRPFYLWLIGDSKYLEKIMSAVDYHKIKGGGVQNIYTVSSAIEDVNYSILPQPRIGKFAPDQSSPKTSIINAKTEKKGGSNLFQLSIGVDYSKLLLEDEYLLDSNNYEISNKSYSLEVTKNTNSSSSYSHIIKLTLNQPIISRGTVKISLLNKMPQWIYDFNDADGLDIHADGAMEKTYGLKYLIEGVFDAYSASSNYASITININ